MPIRKDDEVHVMRGSFKGREGKVTAVYRKKFVIHVERISKDKTNGAAAARDAQCLVRRADVSPHPPPRPTPSAGATVSVGIHPSNVKITKLRMDRERQGLLARKAAGKKKDATVA